MSKSKTMREWIGGPTVIVYFTTAIVAGIAGILCILMSFGSLFGREGIVDVPLLGFGLIVLIVTILICYVFSVLIRE